MNLTCAICLESFTSSCEVSSTPCGHLFHSNCLQLTVNPTNLGVITCPTCRNHFRWQNIHRVYLQAQDTPCVGLYEMVGQWIQNQEAKKLVDYGIGMLLFALIAGKLVRIRTVFDRELRFDLRLDAFASCFYSILPKHSILLSGILLGWAMPYGLPAWTQHTKDSFNQLPEPAKIPILEGFKVYLQAQDTPYVGWYEMEWLNNGFKIKSQRN